MTSADTLKFNKMSQQRVDYQEFPNGAVRARMTVTLPGGKTLQFVEDVTPEDVKTYEAQIAGVEIGYALDEVGWIGSVDQVGFLGGIVKAIGKGIKAVGKGVASVAKGVAKVGKAIVTSKVFQTAAKGLAVVAPVLGPLAPAALGAAGAIGVAGKLLGAKNAAKVGAPRTAAALAKSAVADAKKISPNAAPSLLRIATDKANNAGRLAFGFPSGALRAAAIRNTAAAGGKVPALSSSNALELARAGKIRSSRGGVASPAEVQAAQAGGRLFFVTA